MQIEKFMGEHFRSKSMIEIVIQHLNSFGIFIKMDIVESSQDVDTVNKNFMSLVIIAQF